MKYIDLPKPHGFLLWRGKQTAIASPTLLDSGEKMLVVSDGEPYGEAILSQPVAVNLSSFEDMESQHCIRPEDRKLHWPNADSFYVYRLKSWLPYQQFDDTGKRVLPRKAINILGDGEAQVVELPEPTSEQQKLLEQVERLPKTLILLDEAVKLEDGKAVYCSGVDCSKLEPVLAATLDGTKSADSLPLYQLALVRIPRLAFKEKKSEVKAMPYKVVMDHPECDDDKPVGVVNTETDKLKGCSENEDMAKEHMAALMANEDKSIKELITEARKCYDEGMPLPVMYSGPTTFLDLQALEDANEKRMEMEQLTTDFYVLSSNIFTSPEVEDKAAALMALAGEYGVLVKQAINKKSSNVAEDNKAEQGDIEVETDSKVGKRIRQSMKDRLKAAWETIKEVMDWADPHEDALDMMSKSIAIKQVNGKSYFIAYSANAFEDRENEIFSTKSLEQYVSEAESKADRGTFNFWHIPGSDFAQKEWQAVEGRFLIEAGPFLDNELGQAALKFFNKYPDGHPEISPEGWGCSVEYRYLPEERKSGVYENIWITKTSALPRLAAANVYTKGTIMAVTEQQEKAGKALFGEDLYAKIVKPAEATTKELEEAGVAHKEATVTDEVEVTDDEVAERVAKRIGIDFEPIAEALSVMAETQSKIQSSLDELAGRIKSLEKTEDVKTNTESSRFMVSVLNRASQAEGTKVADDDALKASKPVETQVTDKSGAATFFPARR